MPSKRIIFLHIKKSGGTSFNSVLSSQYFGCKSYWSTPQNPPSQFISLPQEQRDKVKLVRGHVKFGCHDWFSDESTYITILRDPIKRVFSYLNYWKQDAEVHTSNNRKWFQLIRTYSPEELLSQEMHPELENGMVRQLSGKGLISEKCNQNDLDRAMHNLERRCIAFGLTERFDESLAIFKELLRWKLPIVYSSSKIRSTNLIEPNDYLYELIDKYNALDQALYEFAVDLFKSRYQCRELEVKSKKIRRVNHLLSPVTKLIKSLKG